MRVGLDQGWRTCSSRRLSSGPRSIQARPAVLD